jgi:ATP-dependent helicase/nuclease subunit B
VVLANEDLLLPVLNSIPRNIDKINITMGLPIRKTNIYGLYDALFQLHLTTLRMKTSREGSKTAFYFKDIVRLFRHPILTLLLDQHNTVQSPDNFITSLFKSRKTFFYFDTLASIWGDEHFFMQQFQLFFDQSLTHPGQMILSLQQLGDQLDASFRLAAKKEGIEIEQTSWFTDFEALYSINIILRKLKLFLQDQPIDFRTLFMLFQAMGRESKLTLSGEPLEGLQVMGMLETRNLDFKNLILLSANEDILPQSKSNSSFIPYDVKAFFGLPVYKEKDAVYSYHFYRLLQRAEHIHIIYNTQSQDLGSSEKSRYITQLQMELPAWNPNIYITEKIISLPPALQAFSHEIKVEKTDEIFNRLDVINEKGFSPSTLIQYIKCPLLFYFRHIARINETIIPEETIQANTLGTVIHEVMEHLYELENLPGKEITPAHIDNMLKKVDTVTAEKFAEVYKGGDISTGKNLLLSRVAARYVKNYLEHEKQLLISMAEKNSSLTYIKAEEQLTVKLPFGKHKADYYLKFRGFADRIDRLGENTRIIDYKTGKAEKEELKFIEWSELFSTAEKGKSFQLMMYALLYNRTYPHSGQLCPGIIAFRNLSAGVLTLAGPGGNASGVIDQSAIDDFEQHLLTLMQEIFNPEVPFEATAEEKNCTHCDFRIVCNRYTSS